jgi:hypothetical protein
MICSARWKIVRSRDIALKLLKRSRLWAFPEIGSHYGHFSLFPFVNFFRPRLKTSIQP